MDYLFIRLGVLILGTIAVLWGGLIVFSDTCFTYWQNKFWKEKDENQWSARSVTVNRLGTGLAAFLFGIATVYLAIFEM